MDLLDNLFMLPGPVKMHPRVLAAMARPAMAHRGKDFSGVNAEIRELLKYLFRSGNDVAVISGSGTAGLEAAMANVFRRGDKVLCLSNGKFGERQGELASVFAEPVVFEAPWGEPFDLGRLRETVEADPGMKGIALCHNETSTAITNQAEEIGKIARDNDLIYILDGITSVGGIDVRPDEWGADLVVMGSQKCIAAPAGLAALSVSERALARMEGAPTYYLNLKKHVKKLKDGDQTPYTPAIPLFMALRESLVMLKEEGLENRFERCRRLGEACRAAAKGMGLSLFPDERFASNTVTAINYPEGVSDAEFRDRLREEHGVVVAGAQAHIKGKVFRIGHMGLCSFTDMVATIGAVEVTLKKLGYDLELGSGVAAVLEHM